VTGNISALAWMQLVRAFVIASNNCVALKGLTRMATHPDAKAALWRFSLLFPATSKKLASLAATSSRSRVTSRQS
jgi:hypothetical protein